MSSIEDEAGGFSVVVLEGGNVSFMGRRYHAPELRAWAGWRVPVVTTDPLTVELDGCNLRLEQLVVPGYQDGGSRRIRPVYSSVEMCVQ